MKTAFLILLLVIPCRLFATDYERFAENGKVGLRDEQGHVVLPPAFDALGWSDGTFSLIGKVTGYRQGDKWGLINLQHQLLTTADYETITHGGGDRIVISKLINPYTIKVGALDLQGKLAIPLVYDDIDIHGLRAIVMVKEGTRYLHGLIDMQDHTILPIQYRAIEPIGSLRYAVQNFDGKIALCNEAGKWVTGFTIDRIAPFQFDHAIFYEDWKQGIMSRSGDIVVPAAYRDIQILSSTEAVANRPAEWALVDTHLRTQQQLSADELEYDGNGWNRVTLRGQTGVCDNSFQSVWPLIYQAVGRIENGKSVVKKGGRYGLLRRDGSEVMPFSYDSLLCEGNYVRTLKTTTGIRTWTLFDTLGISKSHSYDFIGSFNGTFFPARKGKYWGGLDRFGAERIACVYDSLLQVQGNQVVVAFKGQFGVISEDDRWIYTPQPLVFHLAAPDRMLIQREHTLYLEDLKGNIIYFTDYPIMLYPDHFSEHLPDGGERLVNFSGQVMSRTEEVYAGAEEVLPESEGFRGMRKDHKYGFVDKHNRLVIANRYDSISGFHEGKAAVYLAGHWGFIDRHDNIAVQPAFDHVRDFQHGSAIVRRDGRHGIVDHQGKVLLELRYDSIRRLADGHFILCEGKRKGMADVNGRILIEPRFEEMLPLPHHRVIVVREGKYGLLNVDGIDLLPAQYRLIRPIAGTDQLLVVSEEVTTRISLRR